MRFKNLMLIFGLIITIVACSGDDDGDNFDASAQALIDDATLIEYLQTHHYVPPTGDEVFGVIDTILAGENVTPLFSEVNLKIQDIEEGDINYKLYYLQENAGANISPTKGDSVLVNYRGFTLDSIKFDERLSYTWLSLPNVIRGWQFGFENFKDGNNTTQPGEPLSFDDTGKGILFMPSGLAYGNDGRPTSGIDPNDPLVFFINLGLVERGDHDNDLILSIDEDVDGDTNLSNDDSDNDRIPNFQDDDDDGDGAPTRDEDVNNDGDPRNDDTDGDGIKNYLDEDDDGDGRLSRDESKTQDQDNDGIPDYLDPDN